MKKLAIATAVTMMALSPVTAKAKTNTNMFAFKGLKIDQPKAPAAAKLSFKSLGLNLKSETFGEITLTQNFVSDRLEYKKETSLDLFFNNETRFTPFITTAISRQNILGSRLGFSHDRTSVEGYGVSIGSGLRYEMDDGLYFDGGYRLMSNQDFGLLDNASTDNSHEVRFGFTWELN